MDAGRDRAVPRAPRLHGIQRGLSGPSAGDPSPAAAIRHRIHADHPGRGLRLAGSDLDRGGTGILGEHAGTHALATVVRKDGGAGRGPAAGGAGGRPGFEGGGAGFTGHGGFPEARPQQRGGSSDRFHGSRSWQDPDRATARQAPASAGGDRPGGGCGSPGLPAAGAPCLRHGERRAHRIAGRRKPGRAPDRSCCVGRADRPGVGGSFDPDQ